jgi:U3 small nucleolar RNA-associated protein 12
MLDNLSKIKRRSTYLGANITPYSYEDGTIRIWDSRIDSVVISFNGHKTAVTTLAFDHTGARLASGAKDTDIIIWDLVAEVGLFKLRGHKDQVVALHWLYQDSAEDGIDTSEAFILSASKDALIKIWDVSSQHCIETHIAQMNGECWAMGVSPDLTGCITAGSDGELKVWSIDLEALIHSQGHVGDDQDRRYLHDRGVLRRQGKDRTIGVSFHPRADYFAAHGSEKAVEVWRIRSTGEVQKSMARKRKRRREKNAAEDTNGQADVNMEGEEDEAAVPPITEVFVPHTIVRTAGKVRSIAWINARANKSLQFLASDTNNLVEVYDVPVKERAKKTKSDELADYSRTYSVELPGHRTDVRSVALSSDDRMLASASSGTLKIWNVKTGTCLRTLECGYALCCAFLPGDKIVVVGTKSGALELFDIASSTLIETLEAHEGAIMALQIHPDGRSLVSGSADKSAKFWNFEIVQENIPGTKRTTPRLRLGHTRTLKVNDDILSLCFSPDAKLLAVSTLDNTVKVFFNDSLKLFLNLYGHKLPVLNMSISADSKLIVTCSADKNVRLWGLDFGDCHRAFFAHQDSIMQVSFIKEPPTNDERHHFFSASRDRTIKSWDGDKFEQVQKLEGHHGEIWAMAVSRTGDFIVSASHDKSIRVWIQTDEPIFLEEEREKEMEELYESTLTTSLEADGDGEGDENEVGAASKQTIATLTAGEKIVEALELGLEDLHLIREWEVRKQENPNMAPPQRDPHFIGNNNISAERYVLNTLQRIPASQLHDALLVLPFSVLPPLFTFINLWILRQWDITLVCRVLFFMLKTHQRQIVASRELKKGLEGMRRDLRGTLGEVKDVIGFNLAALRFVEGEVRERGMATLEDVEVELAGDGGRKKRGFVDVA